MVNMGHVTTLNENDKFNYSNVSYNLKAESFFLIHHKITVFLILVFLVFYA